ncbi:hypothetical protein AB0I28_00325 [Phytomonospora sp. NPDC050363]|uniref:hypothetical protein n=1 Tax=Phytomonospora sp. NPDC050363 TaxID=3155642 RepID=UPI0033D0F0A6
MRERVVKLLVFTLAAVLGATGVSVGVAGTAQAEVSAPIPFDYEGKNVRVKIYSRDVGDAENSPVFKFGDLLNRAVRYKTANPAADVRVTFAMYTMSSDVYIGVVPGTASYGHVRDSDWDPDNTEKLTYSMVKAAQHKIDVDFAYQKDAYKPGGQDGEVLRYLESHMDDACVGDGACQVRDHLSARKVTWGDESPQQMHAKYMTVNHYLGDDGGDITDTTYVSTANVDDHSSTGVPVGHDWVQSGTLVNGHPGLLAAYNGYFGKIYDNAYDQAAFHTAVREAHGRGELNFDDAHFSAYFFPIPTDAADGWDIAFNPVAKYVDLMRETGGDRYLKVNVYHLKGDAFGKRLHAELKAIHDAPDPGLEHFRFVVYRNSAEKTWSVVKNFGQLGTVYYGEDTAVKNTHAKNTQFAFSGAGEYYCVTGSTNLKLDENASKANSSLVIKEFTVDHPVYDEFKKIYEYVTLA